MLWEPPLLVSMLSFNRWTVEVSWHGAKGALWVRAAGNNRRAIVLPPAHPVRLGLMARHHAESGVSRERTGSKEAGKVGSNNHGKISQQTIFRKGGINPGKGVLAPSNSLGRVRKDLVMAATKGVSNLGSREGHCPSSSIGRVRKGQQIVVKKVGKDQTAT